ncbi:MAG: hypothetical protein JOZ24_13425 [Candidatus Eremiobacteraeota bacterium]|nr:hypothetical protein [Candidatus Eremiobacteraeota bacterium]
MGSGSGPAGETPAPSRPTISGVYVDGREGVPITAGDTLFITGTNLGTPSRPPHVNLSITGCGGGNMPVVSVATDGSWINVTVPELAVNAFALDASVNVYSAGSTVAQDIWYLAQTDEITAVITVNWIDICSPAFNGCSPPNFQHALSDGGLHFAEGATMNTTSGGEMRACQHWYGCQGGAGTDSFGVDVKAVNDWSFPQGGIVVNCEGTSNPKDCTVGAAVAPWLPNQDPASLYTIVNWWYNGADWNNWPEVTYLITWQGTGPAGVRPMTSFPKTGATSCEN